MKRIILFTVAILSIALISLTSKKNKDFDFKKQYVYIPSGSFELYEHSISVNAFVMSKTEVSNYQYREFLEDLKKEGKQEQYLLAVPDTSAWCDTTRNWQINSMREHYFSHPAYNNYPVVNITKKGANLYCKWLTEKMRKSYPKQNFNDFRLPSTPEWVYAAKGGLKKSPYPWGGPYVRDSEGNILANFCHVGEQNIARDLDGKLVIVKGRKYLYELDNDLNADITAPVRSYNPNGYGLYNMAGNVAELVEFDSIAMGGSWCSPGHDIQVTSQVSATEPNPMTGFRVVSSFIVGKK